MEFLHQLLLEPWIANPFMKRALAISFAVSLSSAPIGYFLHLRRMALIGDALSHAVLPGAALGFILGGLTLPSLYLGGLIAGVLVAFLSALVSQATQLREDSSFATFYLISLALGVVLISSTGTSVDLMHFLFGSLLNADNHAVFLVSGMSSLILILFAVFGRWILLESIDSEFLSSLGLSAKKAHLFFLALVVLGLVSAFQALGTLLAVGLMMIPSATGRLLNPSLLGGILASTMVAVLSSILGLLISYHGSLPPGPAIVLMAGAFYLFALFLAPDTGLLTRKLKKGHYAP